MTVRLDHSRGYRYLRVDGGDLPDDVDGPVYVAIHRLVAFGDGVLDSPRWGGDSREVHHVDGVRSLNGSGNLRPMGSVEHGETTAAAQDALSARETVGVDYATCPSCDDGRPHERLTDGFLRCVVCGHPTEVPDDEPGERRRVEA
jgi:hypothetical protein